MICSSGLTSWSPPCAGNGGAASTPKGHCHGHDQPDRAGCYRLPLCRSAGARLSPLNRPCPAAPLYHRAEASCPSCLPAQVDFWGADTADNERRYRSQRNVYLTGFTLLLFILMRQLFSLTAEAMKANLDKDVMAKQAKNQAEQAEMVAKMLKQDEDRKGQTGSEEKAVEPVAPSPARVSPVADAALQKQIEKQAADFARVFEENASLQEMNAKARADIRALRETNAALESKCEDFDAFFGDEKKKSA